MTSFVNGLLWSIPTVVARFREFENRIQVPHEDVGHYSQDEGSFHRARLQCFAKVAYAKGRKIANPLCCIDLNFIDRQTLYCDDAL